MASEYLRCVQPNSLSRRVDVDDHFVASADAHPPRILRQDERAWNASPFRRDETFHTARPGQIDDVTENTTVAATSPRALRRGAKAVNSPRRVSTFDTRLSLEPDLARQIPVSLVELPIRTTASRTSAFTYGKPVVHARHATAFGPLSTVLVDIAVGEAVRVSRVGPDLAVAACVTVGLLTTARSDFVCAPDAMINGVDETALGEYASTVEVGATAVTIYCSSATRVDVAWNADDVLGDELLGGADLPQPGAAWLQATSAAVAVVLQAPLLESFAWKLEPVR